MNIEPYHPDDQAGVIQLILHIQQQEFGLPITLDDQPDLLTIPMFYQQGNGNFWVARDDNQIVGTIAAIDIGNHQLVLRKMFVAAAYRGGTRGVGQQLLLTLRHWAVQRSISGIYLGTIDRFKAAHRFYQKHGFEPIDQTDLPIGFPVMKGDNCFYQLLLSTTSIKGSLR